MPKKVVIGFYGGDAISAKKTGNKDYQYFSNFSRCRFEYKEHLFFSSEQAFMWEKAVLFKDKKMAKQILNAVTEDDLGLSAVEWKKLMINVKAMGRKVANFDDEIWKEERFVLMRNILQCKFEQDKGLTDILLSTGHCTLAEASARDKIWGIGLSLSNEDVQDPEKWKGQNLLGKALMLVRKTLRRKQ